MFGYIFFKRNSLNKIYIYIYKVKKQNKHCIIFLQSEFNLKSNIILFNPQQSSVVSLRCTSCFTPISAVSATERQSLQYFTMIQYDMWHVICQEHLIIPLQFFEVSYWFTWHIQLWLKAFLKALTCQWNILKSNHAWQAENQSWALCGS